MTTSFKTLYLILGLLFVNSVQAAPFSADPVSFAGFANNVKWSSGSAPFFKNLSKCVQQANGGYICNTLFLNAMANSFYDFRGNLCRFFCLKLRQYFFEMIQANSQIF